ncbi:hypothetical protein AB0H71_17285 [Nocardia sp. NPDC050697]|uniref:hypothetical protein n=1 Tax=Nocardia sp. NPDC050697 TaxID=3155158 RepID=UPI0033ED2F34
MTNDERPMKNLLDAVGNGAGVSLRPEEFVNIERDCEHFKLTIREIQRTMDRVARHSTWNLGENHPLMVSGQTVVDRFRKKAAGSGDGNDVHAVMEQHYKIVEDIQEVHRIVRQRMMDTDADFASEFQRLSTELEERPPVQPKLGPYLLPDGSAR